MVTRLAQNPAIKRYQTCLPAIADADSKTLVLGSFPGVASLNAQQYYHHPRNAFWPICSSALNFGLNLGYPERCTLLIKNKVAVWDVLSHCYRQGSLDSAIETETMRCNDFAKFLHEHPQIQRVLFNGGVARRFFDRFAVPSLPSNRALQLLTMPSTSPAFAAMRVDQKRVHWQLALRNIR